MRGGKEVEENVASKIMGLYAKSSVQQSIGQVDSFDIQGLLGIMPKGIENVNSELDDLDIQLLELMQEQKAYM